MTKTESDKIEAINGHLLALCSGNSDKRTSYIATLHPERASIYKDVFTKHELPMYHTGGDRVALRMVPIEVVNYVACLINSKNFIFNGELRQTKYSSYTSPLIIDLCSAYIRNSRVPDIESLCESLERIGV